jgi:signal transduction histidine kinase
MELFLEETDPNLIIKEIYGIVESLLHGKPIELKLDMQERLPEIIADKLRLRQILLNILSNAIKFTDKGSIVISVRPDDTWLRFSVVDTGIGMSDTEISRAFSEFVQLDTGYARKTGGTGLGLPIAKRFVELHGGTISVESRKNEGTTVSFAIPLLSSQGGKSV